MTVSVWACDCVCVCERAREKRIKGECVGVGAHIDLYSVFV